jgi:RND family efflux transporter MFP subunit
VNGRKWAIALAMLACGDGAGGPETTPPVTAELLQTGVHVRTAAVTIGRLSARDEVSGLVHAFHKATITAETSGRVVERLVERGDAVEAGQPLFRLDASRAALELDQAVATVRLRETDVTHAERELERGLKLLERNAISEQRRDDLQYAVDQAENQAALARVARDTARRALADTNIEAPFAGVVESTEVDTGDFVSAGTPVVSLVELSRARLRAGVTAAEAATLQAGMEAQATFAALGGQSRPVLLKSVGLVADPADGTYDVEFWVDNEEGRLREGMLASVTLPAYERDPSPLVPRRALIRRDGHMAVFLVEPNGTGDHARARVVRIGRSQGDWVEILEGLTGGEQVVVDGHFALADGARVTLETELAHEPEL